MNDDLKSLGQMPPPKPSPAARAHALSLAMQAFDASENNSRVPQGTAGARRQSSIFNRLWSPVMNRKLLAGSALATLLVVPAAAFLTLELTRQGLPVVTGGQQVEVAGHIASKDAEAKKMAPSKPKADSSAETLAADRLGFGSEVGEQGASLARRRERQGSSVRDHRNRSKQTQLHW